ncbi:hypothetical protein VKT23_003017 [Stygiomarasmius scandens]|uniref:Uncharacterized protein n=1 Tax=Marasmiellus scandens TaxID=2682957 RepID=A0ABR1K2A6_9AGAR
MYNQFHSGHSRARSQPGQEQGHFSREVPPAPYPGMTTIDPRHLMLVPPTALGQQLPGHNVSAQQTMSMQSHIRSSSHGSDTGATRSRRLSSGSTSHPYNLPPTPSGRRRPNIMEPTNQFGHHSGLKYYIRIPPEYLPSDNKSDPHTYKRLVRFRLRKAAEDGVVIKVAANKTLPTLEGYSEDVFGKTPERFLHIRMMWPGYGPIGIRMSTDNKKQDVFAFVAAQLYQYLADLKRNGARPQTGYERWDLNKIPFDVNEVVITGLIHRGGSTWQPDIWYPKWK